MVTVDSFLQNKKILLDKGVDVCIDSIYIENENIIGKYVRNIETLHKLHSCSKILVAMAVGIAIDRKMLIDGVPISMETKVYPIIKNIVHVTNHNNLLKIKQWTIKNLLTHTTGYEKQMMSEKFIVDIDKNKLLDYALNFDIPYVVGTRFAYNNVEPFIISVIFQEAFGINLSEFINKYIFEKLEIFDYKWENYGKYCPGSTGLLLKHFDFHKIGQLLLNDGKYNEVQIVPKEWINKMCSFQFESKSEYKMQRLLPKMGMGYFMWISRDGFVFRDGSEGQYIIVNKQKKLLITIMSSEKNMGNVTEILRGLI
ncbi:MAG: serine hydrolase [bacterium]|nr:serine hydrolase [bacterium]